MKFSICLCLFLLQLTYANARLVSQSDAKFIRNNMSGNSKSTQNSEFLAQGRQRSLFARRQYERQRVYKTRPRVHPAHPKGPPPKPAVVPAAPNCSKVSEGCLPHSRCCDPCATCRCRFFNAVCFCRKANACAKRA